MSQENHTDEELVKAQELCALDAKTEEGHTTMGTIRGLFSELEMRLHILNGCRARSLATTNLEQAWMWAEKAYTQFGIPGESVPAT